MAKHIVERGGKQAERWSLLAHIQQNLTKIQSEKLTKWHKVRTQERKNSQRGYYLPWKKAGINPTLANAPKKYASWYYQLKVRHGAVGSFLVKIGVIETPEC